MQLYAVFKRHISKKMIGKVLKIHNGNMVY